MKAPAGNKVLGELLEEIRATPGFKVIPNGQTMKVVGPTGQTTLRCGSSDSSGDDREWRRQLRRFAHWPPPAVAAALNEAQERAEATKAATTPLELPGLAQRRSADVAPVPVARPTSLITESPLVEEDERPVRRRRGNGPVWARAVVEFLRGLDGKRRTFDQIVRAIPPTRYGLVASSASPTLSNHFNYAQPGDLFLHVHRRRKPGSHGFEYWYDTAARSPEPPVTYRMANGEPEPTVPEPEPVTPLVIPDPEPVTPVVPEPEPAPSVRRVVGRDAVELPEVFERVGELFGDLLLRDENGDIWRARKGLS